MATLGEAFDEAVRLHTAIEQSEFESIDSRKQEMVKQCIEKFQELWRSVQAAGVFSRNEDRDDVATSDIRFFLVPYYLGDLQERIVDTQRAQNLRNGIACFEFFIKACLDYSICTERERDELLMPLNPTDRTGRIERLKRRKELQAKLAELSERRKHLTRRIQSQQEAEGEKEEDDSAPEQGELEATSRSYWFLSVEDRLRACSQQLHMSRREAEMLQSLTPEQKEEAAEEYQLRMRESMGVAPSEGSIRKVTNEDIAMTGPQVVTSLPMDREKILAEVFINRNPATMSDDEYARIQMERMLPSDPPPPPEGEEHCSDDDDDEEKERKRKKASDWDDWKDGCARDGNMGANIG